jgi:ligand-binding sensor domain-containing protein
MKNLTFFIISFFLTLSVHSQTQWIIYNSYNSGLPSNMVGSIVIDSNNVKWLTTNNGFVKFNGNAWTVYDTTNSGLPQNVCGPVAKDKLNYLWIATGSKGVVKYDGINWTVYNNNNTGVPINYAGPFAFDNNNTKWIVGVGLFKYNDTNWVWYNSSNSGLPSNMIVSVFVQNNNIVWVGSIDAGVTRYDGNTWTVYNYLNSGLPWNWTTKITKDKLGNLWFSTFGGGVAKFNYEQNVWTVYDSENSGLTDENTYCIYIDSNNVKWIGGPGGCDVFNDTVWQNFSYSFIGDVFNFAKDKYGNMWICSDNGLYVYNPTGVIGVENNSTVVSGNYLLIQSYPNPFNPTTNIKYTIPLNKGSATSFVSLKIYDLLGREITTLVNDYIKPGSYEVQFTGNNLSSGIYFAILKADSKIKVHKIMLQK